jgi:hypothetical protein
MLTDDAPPARLPNAGASRRRLRGRRRGTRRVALLEEQLAALSRELSDLKKKLGEE